MPKSKSPRLTIRALKAVGVEVPMAYALGTSGGAITKAPLLLIDWPVTPRAFRAEAKIP